MNITGYCRFSWLGASDTGREIADVEAAQVKLWNAERMAIRFHLFEHLTLPCLAAQTDQDFRMVVVTSPEMPDIYHQRLEHVTAPHKFIEILNTAERHIAYAIRPIMLERLDGEEKATHFRLDDDDALASGYIARLREISPRLHARTAISFPRGVAGLTDGKAAKHAPMFKSFIAIGLAYVYNEKRLRDPFSMPHRQVVQRWASYIDPGLLAYHWSLHGANNTKGYDLPVADASPERRGISRILNAHPHLADKDSSPEVDAGIAEAFPFTDGPRLRQILLRTLEPENLAEEMSFL